MRGLPLMGPISLVRGPLGGGAAASARPARISWFTSGLLGRDVPRPNSRPEPRPYALVLGGAAGETAFWNSLLIGCVNPAVLAAAPENATSALTRRSTGKPRGPNCSASACTSVPVL